MRVERARMRLWHGRGAHAIKLLADMPDMIEMLYVGDSSTLQRDLEELSTYLQSNERHLVNHAERYRKTCRSAAHLKSRQSINS